MLSRSSAQPDTTLLALSEPKYIPTEKTICYQLGERPVPIKIYQYGPGNEMVCINMHDNEYTSVQAAKSVLELRGGTLIHIENNSERLIRFRLRGTWYSFDPNRIFSRVGIEASLEENGRVNPAAVDEVERFGQRILEMLTGSSCVIALHNNTPGAYSIHSYLPGGDRVKDAKATHTSKDEDADDIALTTDKMLFQKMAARNYNCILQDNDKAKKDGSLSIYCGEHGIRYINIETEHGRIFQYRQMFADLIDILTESN
jgi:hypothetical protein